MKKKLLCLLTILLLLPTLTGCSVGRFVQGVFHGEQEEIEESVYDGYIYGESSTLGIDSNEKGYLEKLTDNTYYVIHDDIWYPLSLYYTNFDENQDVPEKEDTNRIVCVNEEYDKYIPTLYSTDKLVYYSTQNILDYTTFERFKDLGWTFPIISYSTITDGRLYLYFDKSAELSEYIILPDSPFYTIYNKDNDVYMYIDKIGGINVDNTMLNECGLFSSEYLKKGNTMDFECYRGTVYEHYSVDVNTHAFGGYEIYAQPYFTALQSYVYEIPVPDYLLSGYYMINNAGLLRYVKDELPIDSAGNTVARYSDNYDFNVPLLYPIQDDRTEGYDGPYRYSELEELNLYGEYAQAEEGTFGYIEPDKTTEEEVAENAKKLLRASFAKAYYFKFPKDKECSITIVSSTGEKTGDIKLTMDNGRLINIPYDIFNDNYNVVLTGEDNIGELYITGLFDNYTIQLKNATQTTAEEATSKETDDSVRSTDTTEDTTETTSTVPETITDTE